MDQIAAVDVSKRSRQSFVSTWLATTKGWPKTKAHSPVSWSRNKNSCSKLKAATLPFNPVYHQNLCTITFTETFLRSRFLATNSLAIHLSVSTLISFSEIFNHFRKVLGKLSHLVAPPKPASYGHLKFSSSQACPIHHILRPPPAPPPPRFRVLAIPISTTDCSTLGSCRRSCREDMKHETSSTSN